MGIYNHPIDVSSLLGRESVLHSGLLYGRGQEERLCPVLPVNIKKLHSSNQLPSDKISTRESPVN